MQELITTGDLARELGVPLHRITYLIQRHQIKEDARAGVYRLYRRDTLQRIRDQILSSNHRNGGAGAGGDAKVDTRGGAR